jgi:cytidylate kinase
MQKKITIAIDGYAACGKSTLAKALAQQLHYIFIDSGAMYRAVAFYCLENELIDSEGVIQIQELEMCLFLESQFCEQNFQHCHQD